MLWKFYVHYSIFNGRGALGGKHTVKAVLRPLDLTKFNNSISVFFIVPPCWNCSLELAWTVCMFVNVASNFYSDFLECSRVFKIYQAASKIHQSFGDTFSPWSLAGFTKQHVTGPSGTVDFAILTLSEVLSLILIRCVTWHWASDCSFRCFRHFQCKTRTKQDRARTQRTERLEGLEKLLEKRLFLGANPGFLWI